MIAPSWNRNRLTARLGIDYPVIQGPLGGLASQRLTAAVSNFGGLGSFGALTLAPEAIRDVVAEIRALTAKPFAVNLWVSMEDEGARTSDESAFDRSLAPLAGPLAALGAARPAYKPYAPAVRFEDQVRMLLDAKVPVISFIFGIPPREILDKCRAKNIVTIGAATTAEEALTLQEAGVDAIAASGFEAGGHRGSFLRAAEDSLTGTFSLVPQIVDAVEVPVIAAGGIANARGVIAALALGAEAVQMGTAFLTCEESGSSPLHRETLRGGDVKTALTKGFTGRLARGIRNRLMEELNRPGTEILPYPLQRGLVRNLSVAAEAAGRSDLLPMWAGQSANLSTCTDVAAFLTSLIEDVSAIAGPVVQWSAKRRGKGSHQSSDRKNGA
jgi:nitronate monooxygenase